MLRKSARLDDIRDSMINHVNQNAIFLAKNLILSDRSKHIRIYYYNIRDFQEY
jgi:hypothetical protein